MGTKERYLELVTTLHVHSARTDSEISEEHDDELDRLWWLMSRSEQDEVEAAVANLPDLIRPRRASGDLG